MAISRTPPKSMNPAPAAVAPAQTSKPEAMTPAAISKPTASAAQSLASAKGKTQATPPSGPPPNDGFSSQPRGGAPQAGGGSFLSKMSPANLFAPNPQKAAMKQDVASLQNAPGGFIQNNSLYHSTSSAALDGIGKTGGLAPASMLNQQGIQRKTGEGDQYSGQAGEKDFISFGQGKEGLGSSRAYFKQTQSSPGYSPHLYSNDQLGQEIKQSKQLLEKYNLPANQGQKPVGDMVDKPRVEARLRHLEAEQSLRQNMPARETPFPVMFDLKGDKLQTKPMHAGAPGEAAVHGPAMFKDNLQRVFVPADKVPEMKQRMDSMMGPGHKVQVMSFESQTQFLDQERQAKGRNGGNPAHVALRTEENVMGNLNNMERNRKHFYTEAENRMSGPSTT